MAFEPCRARGAFSAIWAAISSARGMSWSGWTTSVTKPHWSACSGEMRWEAKTV